MGDIAGFEGGLYQLDFLFSCGAAMTESIVEAITVIHFSLSTLTLKTSYTFEHKNTRPFLSQSTYNINTLNYCGMRMYQQQKQTFHSNQSHPGCHATSIPLPTPRIHCTYRPRLPLPLCEHRGLVLPRCWYRKVEASPTTMGSRNIPYNALQSCNACTLSDESAGPYPSWAS